MSNISKLQNSIIIFGFSIFFTFTSIIGTPISYGNLGSETDFIDFGRWTTTPFSYSVSSSFSSEYGGFNLFDSDSNTHWYSTNRSGSEWIIVDFGSKRLINGLEITVPLFRKERAAKKYEVQVLIRDDWRTIFVNQDVTLHNFHKLENLDASVLRIYFPDTTDRGVVISDLKLFLNQQLLNGIEPRLRGYTFPVPDGLIPNLDFQLPNAPRVYRNGVHKGIDIYKKKEPSGQIRNLNFQDEAVSPADGVIVRADHSYFPMTSADYEYHTSQSQKGTVTYVEKDFGGRQVWIDHGHGVMSSFNHLSSIRKNLKIGNKVKRGEVIGTIGNSGLMEEAKGITDNAHLHFEIWVDGEFFGNGVAPVQVRKMLQFFFKRNGAD
ncbi:M23 family metallopeptidase [Leptospira borgpetersenii]|uniref:M23 family metallopeptidase n=1 Tax=Leptospira borgpetersenii TaxID=174 RepID=UPI0007736527|nr:M23 family metallopeptidase [Leptospira borgpetersenii]MBE8363593.1 M23 family metallopeptidase [Leptospira borgpetersenii serovar Balcanica]MBE8367316.1 M23 family metallopeptidase [Leptospira borgpetersenii serovar Balcanica]MBE8400969.1 M23 family metallopeptidase [Leptospira borgpetersenii serovar Tarassovi]MBE8403022.1 M23 family metallopeptidase [Leptospira borgpetersenii serovar Tarassovi]MBE8407346.1 M23 family metallopeptidase [Leptospira borgpetersenii serovar Tarassovi]